MLFNAIDSEKKNHTWNNSERIKRAHAAYQDVVAVGQPVKGIGGHLGDHGGVVEEVVLRPEDTFGGDSDDEGDMVSVESVQVSQCRRFYISNGIYHSYMQSL